MIGEFRSYINTFKVFRPFFSLKRLVLEVLLFPLEYFLARPFFLPSSISFLITHKCNLKCECCFDKDFRNQSSMAVSDFTGFLERLGKNYKPSVFFSGGEPFLHPDVMDFFRACTEKDITFGVVTNGMIFTEAMQKEISSAMPAVLIFSVHGSKAVHDRVVGCDGAFVKMCENIKIFSSYANSPKIVLNYIFNKDAYNADDLRLFISDIGGFDIFPDEIRFNHLNYILPVEQKAQTACSYMDSFDEVKYRLNPVSEPLINMDEARLEDFLHVLTEYKNIYNFSFKPYLSNNSVLGWYNKAFSSLGRKCFFPLKSLSFDSDGRAFFCQKIFFKNPDMHNSDIKSIWFSKEANHFRRYLRRGLFPVCHRCCKL